MNLSWFSSPLVPSARQVLERWKWGSRALVYICWREQLSCTRYESNHSAPDEWTGHPGRNRNTEKWALRGSRAARCRQLNEWLVCYDRRTPSNAKSKYLREYAMQEMYVCSVYQTLRLPVSLTYGQSLRSLVLWCAASPLSDTLWDPGINGTWHSG